MIDTKKPGPIEVVLTQANLEVTCLVVHEDESTDSLAVDALSMRGAQREITGHLIGRGYAPEGRWEQLMGDSNGPSETMRRFRAPAAPASA